MPEPLTAAAYLKRLEAMQSDDELRKIRRYFKLGEADYAEGDRFIGVRMGDVFKLSQEFMALPPREFDKLLDSDIHEARAGALSAMAKQARHSKTTPERRAELYALYLRRHDRINNWDLVDLAAWHVVGPYLVGKPHDVLHDLARSSSIWERRTAILATYAFIKAGDVSDTLAIAELLLDDPQDLIHKAVGGMLRTVGINHRPALLGFLDRHAAAMPRTMLRYALEHFEPKERERYMAAGSKAAAKRG